MSELPRHVADSNNAPDLVDWLGTKNLVPTLNQRTPSLIATCDSRESIVLMFSSHTRR